MNLHVALHRIKNNKTEILNLSGESSNKCHMSQIESLKIIEVMHY